MYRNCFTVRYNFLMKKPTLIEEIIKFYPQFCHLNSPIYIIQYLAVFYIHMVNTYNEADSSLSIYELTYQILFTYTIDK